MSEPLNPELERAIAVAPDDPHGFLVYADWLVEHGNPRGELALAQLAGDAKREAELLERHAAAFHTDHGAVRYRGGFWRELRCAVVPAVLAELLAHPSARLLYRLAVDWCDDAVEALAAARPLEALRVLRLGDMPERLEFTGFGGRTCGDLDRLGAAAPRLDTLRLLCPGFALGDHPTLRVLDVRMGVTQQALERLGSARLPRLEQIDLGFDPEDLTGIRRILWPDEALDPLLASATLPALRVLRLWPMVPDPDEVESVGELVERIQGSPLGQRLERLEVVDWRTLEADDPDGDYRA
jgi:uncharacterized protein (TIGR02996 family)